MMRPRVAHWRTRALNKVYFAICKPFDFLPLHLKLEQFWSAFLPARCSACAGGAIQLNGVWVKLPDAVRFEQGAAASPVRAVFGMAGMQLLC